MRRLAGYFFALTLAFAPVLAAAQQVTGGGGGGASPGGVSGDVQTNNGSGGLNGVTVLTVPNGGTGAATLAAHGTVTAEGTGAFVAATPGTSGWVWTSNGAAADPTWQAAGAGSGCTTTCTYTGTQTINAPANTLAFVTSGSTTGASTVGGYSLAHTLNTSGASFDLFKFAITDTAKGAGVKAFSIYGGPSANVSLFSVDMAGQITTNSNIISGNQLIVATGSIINWNGGGGTLSSPAANTVQLGNNDTASPSAQTFSMQSVSAGTTNTAGADAIIAGSKGTGTGAGGALQFQTSLAGTTGTAQNPLVTQLKIDGKGHMSAPGTAPAVSSCGTGSPSVTGSDIAGQITTGTSATTCTLTFKTAYAAAPGCVMSDKTLVSHITSYTVSTSAIVLTMTSNSGDVISYICIGA